MSLRDLIMIRMQTCRRRTDNNIGLVREGEEVSQGELPGMISDDLDQDQAQSSQMAHIIDIE